MAVDVAIPAIISAIDTMGGGDTVVVNVDLRQSPSGGGFFTFEMPAADLANASFTLEAELEAVDTYGGGATVDLNVDLRTSASASDSGGGFFSARVPVALTSGPAAPTTGSVAGGTLAARTDRVKITYVEADGTESTPSPEATQALAVDTLLTVTSPSAETGATGYNVYATDGASGTETLQNSAPIAIGTNWQEPASGLVSDTVPPTSEALFDGVCSVVVAVAAAPIAVGACTLTIKQ